MNQYAQWIALLSSDEFNTLELEEFKIQLADNEYYNQLELEL